MIALAESTGFLRLGCGVGPFDGKGGLNVSSCSAPVGVRAIDDLLPDPDRSLDGPTKQIRRWRIGTESLVLAFILLAGCGAGAVWYFAGEDRDDCCGIGFASNGALFGELTNWDRHEIEQRYGTPEQEWEGYRPLGSQSPAQLPEGRIKTLLFRGRGGINNADGTVMVWLVARRRGWVCFHSGWFGNNVGFP